VQRTKWNGNGNGMTTNEMKVLSYVAQRAGLAGALGQQFSGNRDLYDALGYKKVLRFRDYFAKYDRENIAGRIVDMPASASWRRTPTVKDGEEEDENTEFEQAWGKLSDRLGIYHYLERADRLAGIGRFAVLVIGARGHGTLTEELTEGDDEELAAGEDEEEKEAAEKEEEKVDRADNPLLQG